jgi:hypothetical protein
MAEMEAMEIVAEAIEAGDPGCLDAGSIAADSWYCLWVIGKCTASDNVVTDVAALASLSFTNPTLPTGYTHRRRVSFFRTDGSADIKPFYHHEYYWGYVEAPLLASDTQATQGDSGILEIDMSDYFCSDMAVLANVIIKGDAPSTPSDGYILLNVHGETITASLSSAGIAVSDGSACYSPWELRVVDDLIDWMIVNTVSGGGTIYGYVYITGMIIPVWEEVQG